MSYTDFIPDDKFKQAVRKVLEVRRRELARPAEGVFRNVVDPYSAVFDAIDSGLLYSAWLEIERVRQIQKSMQNAIGTFHEDLLLTSQGWEKITLASTSLTVTIKNTMPDIHNMDRRIVAELKNKFNTVKASDEPKVYDALAEWVTNVDAGFTAYMVHIIPKGNDPYNAEWRPVQAGVARPNNPLVRLIDGRSFYSLVFNRDDALDEVFRALPIVVQDVKAEIEAEMQDSSVYPAKYRKKTGVKEGKYAELQFDATFDGLFRRAYPWKLGTPPTDHVPINEEESGQE